MKYNLLGKSEIEISETGFGCMSLENNQQLTNRLVHKALDHGINYFDTADLYDRGHNEEMLGKALSGRRNEAVIATKVGNVWQDDGSGWDWNPGYDMIMQSVRESLNRLQTDYIDVYQLHGGTIEDPFEDIVRAFEELKEKGIIRSYGISSIRPNVIRKYAAHSSIDSVMMQYSLLDRRPEESCLDLLHDHQISVLSRGSLAKGLLIDKEPTSYLGYDANEVADLQQLLNEEHHPLAAALQFVLRHKAVSSAVTGIRTEKQLDEILEAGDLLQKGNYLPETNRLPEPKCYEKHR